MHSDKTLMTEIEQPLDRSKVSCIIATWRCMLDQVQVESIQHTLIQDTIHMLEDYRAGRRI